MTSRDFCYWLQGFFEIGNEKDVNLSAEQTEMIRRHLALVFKHEIDPSAGPPVVQAALNAIHDPPKPSPPISAQPTWGPSSGGGGGLIRC